MYNVGDKIVYPMHGAGIIESIEEREILGKKQLYYVLLILSSGMRVMIPVERTDVIREVIDLEVFERVIEVFREAQAIDNNANWNKRYRENMLKIRTGNIFEVAEVVKSLMIREREKGLSAGEKKMLLSAKQILISELVLAKNMEQDEVETMIDSVINSQ